MNKLKAKILSSKFYVALCALVGLIITAPRSQAVFTPIDFDPADMIAQVSATAADVMPFIVALIAGGLVFRLIKRWAK